MGPGSALGWKAVGYIMAGFFAALLPAGGMSYYGSTHPIGAAFDRNEEPTPLLRLYIREELAAAMEKHSQHPHPGAMARVDLEVRLKTIESIMKDTLCVNAERPDACRDL